MKFLDIKVVKSGYRVALTYNLVLKGYKGRLNTLTNTNFHDRLEKSLKHYFYGRSNEEKYSRSLAPKLIYLLDHQYTQAGLSWDTLKNLDRERVAALIKAAKNLNLDIHLSLADMQETWDDWLHDGRPFKRRLHIKLAQDYE